MAPWLRSRSQAGKERASLRGVFREPVERELVGASRQDGARYRLHGAGGCQGVQRQNVYAYATERSGNLVRVALASASTKHLVCWGMTAPQQFFLDEATGYLPTLRKR